MESIFEKNITMEKGISLISIKNKILNIQLMASIILLMAMFATIVIQIIYRELFNNNFDWVIEFNRILFSWIVFLGASYGVGKKSHMRFEFLFNKMTKKKPLEIIIEIVSLVFFIVVIVQGQKMVKFGSRNTFSTLPLSFLWMYLPTVICGIFSSILTVINIAEIIKRDEE